MNITNETHLNENWGIYFVIRFHNQPTQCCRASSIFDNYRDAQKEIAVRFHFYQFMVEQIKDSYENEISCIDVDIMMINDLHSLTSENETPDTVGEFGRICSKCKQIVK